MGLGRRVRDRCGFFGWISIGVVVKCGESYGLVIRFGFWLFIFLFSK